MDETVEALVEAATDGQLDEVERLLDGDDAKSLLEAKDKEVGHVVLHGACEGGNLSLVNKLLAFEVDVNALGPNDRTVLHSACESGKTDLIRRLLDLGLDLAATDVNGFTPLRYACNRGDIAVVELLLAEGADATVLDKEGETLLHTGCRGGLDVVKLMLKRGLDVNALDDYGRNALHFAVEGNNLDVVKYLMEEHGLDVKSVAKNGMTMLHSACMGGSVEMAKFLLACGLDLDAEADLTMGQNGWTPFRFAIETNNIELATYFSMASELTASEGDKKDALDPAGVNESKALTRTTSTIDTTTVDKDGWSALHTAAKSGNLEMAKLLLSLGVDANTCDKDQWSVLHTAANTGNVAISCLLLEHGANAKAVDKDGYSVLHCATTSGNIELVEMLLAHGADAFAVDVHGLNILHISAVMGFPDMFEFFIRIGLDVMARTENGCSTIHLVTNIHKHEAINLLVERGLDVHLRDNQGHTALALCLQWSPDEDDFAAVLQTAYTLMSNGAVFEASPDNYPQVGEKNRDQAAIIPICVDRWTEEQRRGKKNLTQIPPEVFVRGPKAVQTYLDEISASSDSDLVLRRKVCVIGSSKTGKSSLIRSITTMAPTLVDIEDRTIGVDLFSLDFTEASDEGEPAKNHQITIWDFAGQDEYQVAHTLFFSRRTLYLLCVDTEAFGQVVDESRECDDEDEAEAMIDAFVKDRVWRWFRLVFLRQPDAEFVFVATKVDAFGGVPERLKELEDMMMDILGEYKASFDEEVNQETQALQDKMVKMSYGLTDNSVNTRVRHLERMRTRLNESLPTSWLAVDVTKANSIHDARTLIERVVTQSDRSFLMPDKYSRVLEMIKELRVEPPHQTTKARIKQIIVPLPELREQLVQGVNNLEPEDCETILETLHDLGDVLWYDRDGLGVLGDTVILSARLLIDLVRQIICHDPIKNVKKTRTSARVAKLVENMLLSGQVPHELVTTFTLWKSLEYPNQMQRFKKLLQHFQLAYPANTTSMETDSDLIVPTFWKLREDQLDTLDLEPLGDKFRSSLAQDAAASIVRVFHWEYDFHFEMVETIFEQLVVQSYSVFSKRTAYRSCVESIPNPHYAIRLSLVKEDGRQIISLEIAAADTMIAEEYLRELYQSLEAVLSDYPGVAVTRYGVDEDGGRERIDQMVDLMRRSSPGRQVVLRNEHEWFPENLNWYKLPGERDTSASPQSRLEKARAIVEVFLARKHLKETRPSQSWQKLLTRVSSQLSGRSMKTEQEEVTFQLPPQLATLPGGSFRSEMKAFVKDELVAMQTVLMENMGMVGNKLLQTSAGDGNHRDLPALWMVEYVQKPKARLILWILSEISGRCFHKPIEIAVSRQFLAKHGDKIQLGLSIFSSVLPDAPVVSVVKSAIDMASPILDNELAHARSVHDLLGNLGLENGGALNTSKQRPVSPAGMYGLLRALLKIHDPDFEPDKICDLAKLECGMVLQEGGYRWAHRHELLREPELYKLRVNYASDSVHSVVSSHVPSQADIKSGSEVEPLYYLSDFRASGLVDDEARLAYCTWELVNRAQSVRIGGGETIQNPYEGPVESWWQEAFVLSDVKAENDLSECELVVEVKRPSKLILRSDRFVGRGFIMLREVLSSGTKLTESCRFVIPLTKNDGSPSSGTVECQLWGSGIF
ncbi:hypothetical protein Poli38472_001807 [Pythium oligandrum]|uniref:Non-specific serine/threonine protein kinase n=1 Tax=Pythium oligandrum TaxID=41045 RepID=A0A8K1CTM4_PYTOL|nr:hypothetical protein Poli38472_001807 [Pythium oligandrum]|eukprot:TMW69651.1 hypothetical protein Poli38472_001807 [Pythium oligandrum]